MGKTMNGNKRNNLANLGKEWVTFVINKRIRMGKTNVKQQISKESMGLSYGHNVEGYPQ